MHPVLPGTVALLHPPAPANFSEKSKRHGFVLVAIKTMEGQKIMYDIIFSANNTNRNLKIETSNSECADYGRINSLNSDN